ncbi:hypothetical protein PR048_021489 [Dryococelus australis]|uniref:Uncharacterized protein n=1 Tax=Dryococelus australis TaxID=614101 RepID=A0ABQ9GYB5_9NEOP|nr:hypothetical protein PR048_021489 [Dryococelus australis]
MSLKHLYEFAVCAIHNIHLVYSTTNVYNSSEKKLSPRFQDAKTIPCTQKIHCVIPLSETTVTTRLYSLSDGGKVHNISETSAVDLATPSVTYILAKHDNSDKLKVNFLHHKGPSPSFCFSHPDIKDIPANTVLMKVEPPTPIGHVYVLNEDDNIKSTNMLKQRIKLM